MNPPTADRACSVPAPASDTATLSTNPLCGDVEITLPLHAWGARYGVTVAWNQHDPLGLTAVLVDPLPPVHALSAYLLLVEHAARFCAQRADVWQADDPRYAGLWRQAAARLRFYRAGYEAAAAEEQAPAPLSPGFAPRYQTAQ